MPNEFVLEDEEKYTNIPGALHTILSAVYFYIYQYIHKYTCIMSPLFCTLRVIISFIH